MFMLLKSMHSFNVSQLKYLQHSSFSDLEKMKKFIWKHKRYQIAKAISNIRLKAIDITILDFKM